MCPRPGNPMHKIVLPSLLLAATLTFAPTLGCSGSSPSHAFDGGDDARPDGSNGSGHDGQATDAADAPGQPRDASTGSSNHDAGPADAGGPPEGDAGSG